MAVRPAVVGLRAVNYASDSMVLEKTRLRKLSTSKYYCFS